MFTRSVHFNCVSNQACFYINNGTGNSRPIDCQGILCDPPTPNPADCNVNGHSKRRVLGIVTRLWSFCRSSHWVFPTLLYCRRIVDKIADVFGREVSKMATSNPIVFDHSNRISCFRFGNCRFISSTQPLVSTNLSMTTTTNNELYWYCLSPSKPNYFHFDVCRYA
eukprot:m.10950 g.10950  ORF g.10950 m.10950 type:complete len:166 (+) comp22824_c0_seq2:524-1021(+)